MIRVRLASNGQYWQAVYVDADTDKVVKRESLGSKAKLSRRQAGWRCQELATKYTGGCTPDAKATLSQWRTELLRHLAAESKERTVAAYETTLDRLEERMGGAILVAAVTKLDARDFASWLREPRRVKRGDKVVAVKLTESTVRGHIARAKVVFSRAVDMDIIETSPFARIPSSQPSMATPWKYVHAADVAKIIDACANPLHARLFAFARYAGLRCGEILRLRSDDVDLPGRRIRVWPEGGVEGTKQRARVVPIDPSLYAFLTEHPLGKYVYSATTTAPNNLRRDLLAAVKRAGVAPYGKPLHNLRKSRETDWLSTYPVMDVCAWLGHDPSVAQRHYHAVRTESFDKVTGQGAKS